jgi:hypothetical protein
LWPDSALTLEHILDKEYDSAIHTATLDEHKDFLHRLGNLALLGEEENGAIQASTFTKKRGVYSKAGNPSLTQEVAKFTTWGAGAIEKRQRQLAVLAAKAWPL